MWNRTSLVWLWVSKRVDRNGCHPSFKVACWHPQGLQLSSPGGESSLQLTSPPLSSTETHNFAYRMSITHCSISRSNIRNGRHYFWHYLLLSTRCFCHHYFNSHWMQGPLGEACFWQQLGEGIARALRISSPSLGKSHTNTFRKWYRLLVVFKGTDNNIDRHVFSTTGTYSKSSSVLLYRRMGKSQEFLTCVQKYMKIHRIFPQLPT